MEVKVPWVYTWVVCPTFSSALLHDSLKGIWGPLKPDFRIQLPAEQCLAQVHLEPVAVTDQSLPFKLALPLSPLCSEATGLLCLPKLQNPLSSLASLLSVFTPPRNAEKAFDVWGCSATGPLADMQGCLLHSCLDYRLGFPPKSPQQS